MAAGFLVELRYGFGKYVENESLEAIQNWYKAFYATENLYTPTIAMVKLSILLLYVRVFPGVQFRRFVYGMGTVVALWWVACQCITVFECTPIHFFWTETPTTGHCVNVRTYFIGQAIPNIITDLLIMALPLPPIWKLNLPRRQKFALSGIFLLGCFVTFASIYRIVILSNVPADNNNPVNAILVDDPAGSHYLSAAIWTLIEPHMAIICTCLPMLRRLFKRNAHRLHTSAKEISHPVTKADDRHPNRRRSFERLHETSEDLWEAGDSGRTAIPSTITTISKSALDNEHEIGVALDVIRVTDEVHWSNIEP
ncbi:hypothetical protein MMC22_009527 [Lobaria immixta]|nr:hypothetical protein [Lobaria immixta]